MYTTLIPRHLWLASTLLLSVPVVNAQTNNTVPRDLYADTWVASDALGRTMPDSSTAGAVKKDQQRVVGIFYITWHSDQNANGKSPYLGDVSKVLAKDPEARLDAKHPGWTVGTYHWGEPEMGYFLSKDEYVIRKDMSMLADADNNPATGWYGYDFLLNRQIKNDSTTTLMHYDSTRTNDPWVSVADVKFRYAGHQLELAVPRKLLGLHRNTFIFDFKWSDHAADLKDPISLCVDGDTAPNRRFNYRCIWEK